MVSDDVLPDLADGATYTARITRASSDNSLGFTVAFNREADAVRVAIKKVSLSVSESTGLRVGDQILSVNGEDATAAETTPARLIAMLSTPAVVLVMRRVASAAPIERTAPSSSSVPAGQRARQLAAGKPQNAATPVEFSVTFVRGTVDEPLGFRLAFKGRGCVVGSIAAGAPPTGICGHSLAVGDEIIAVNGTELASVHPLTMATLDSLIATPRLVLMVRRRKEASDCKIS